MTKPISIEKNKSLRTSQDYEYLRNKGIEHIQKLSGHIWTDHNIHDPGITTLEILCYALTDLGYRTDFEIKDLLTTPPDPEKNSQADDLKNSSFFPAQDILTNTPLTINDYRTLLLRIKGIRNAWLDPMVDPGTAENEKPVYIDCLKKGLSFRSANSNKQANTRLELSGLYKVLLELEIDDVLGSLNETRLLYTVKTGPLKGKELSIDIPDFSEKKTVFAEKLPEGLNPVFVSKSGPDFIFRLELANQVVVRELKVIIQDKADINSVTQEVIGEQLAAALPFFWCKQHKINQVMNSVSCVLHAHRNLCEDFCSIETVKPEHISLCADIEVKSDADMEKVQAQVFFAVEQYFNPTVGYYSLREMLDQGLHPDEIFNGPYLDYGFTCADQPVFAKPGFIKTEEIKASKLRKAIYGSDIINILMDFDQIVSVKNLMFRKYNADGTPARESKKWCLKITRNHQPVLNIGRSKVLFFKNEIPYSAKQREFADTLDHLRAMSRKAAYTEAGQTLKLPRGKYRDTETHFSIQHDYPQVYGIGEEGLPGSVQPERVNQARQLKGYLTFYDQVLADYLSQLANISKLFSLDKDIEQTYFSQFMTNIAGVADRFEDEFYMDKTFLKEPSQRKLLAEDEILFYDRRNRALDHLIARFSEQFTDYVLMMHNLTGDALKLDKEITGDKIDFLQEYPVISRERNKAFNYLPRQAEDAWDTDNVSGLEKRVSRLTGIRNYKRRNLARCGELSENGDQEGFYLFEHILFRPLSGKEDRLMNVCLGQECEACGDEDPYSFRISVILPCWTERFQRAGFRRYFEKTLREQAPAHIHARICWISNEQMTVLQEKYREWLKTRAEKKPDQQTLRNLIEILEQLKTVYPAATLHDCLDDDEGSPVRLGSTNLGSFR